MNYRVILRVLGALLLLEALCMLPAFAIAEIYRDGDGMALLLSAGITGACGLPLWQLSKPKKQDLRAKEGFFIVALVWVVLSLFGALPFVFSRVLPNYMDALFETVSGFTTTGATTLVDFDSAPHGILFWRSFTHWIGGMGVLVLTLALLPQLIGRASFLMKAESPGPEFSKILPKTGNTAKVLYLIYGVLSLAEFVLLLFAGLSPYDAAIHTMGTAGTGGFSNYALSVGAFDSVWVDAIITFFMVVFGINFALFYRSITGGIREALHSEELKWFLRIFVAAVVLLTVILTGYYGNVFTALRHGSFQAASIISTTGYATTDFNLWPVAAKMILFLLMFVGSCAGSTAGGMKVVRVVLLFKLALREIHLTIHPRKVEAIRFEGRVVDKEKNRQITLFFFIYIACILVGSFLLSLEGQYGLEENITAALTCVSNVGPGLGAIGPAGSFADYGMFSKFVMVVLMLCGRLELFPILVLFHPDIWKRGN